MHPVIHSVLYYWAVGALSIFVGLTMWSAASIPHYPLRKVIGLLAIGWVGIVATDPGIGWLVLYVGGMTLFLLVTSWALDIRGSDYYEG